MELGDRLKEYEKRSETNISVGEQETCVRSRLNRLSTSMNTYSEELVDLITIRSV